MAKFTCAECGATFESQEELEQHNDKEHGSEANAGGE
jgi:hypothetical protein